MKHTIERDKAAQLAKTDPEQALMVARSIVDPWFRAQALALVARHGPFDPATIAAEAANAALKGHDHYRRSAVRAWEIAALAERGMTDDAHRSLCEAKNEALLATPNSSQCESLLLLCHAAARISITDLHDIAMALLGTGISDVSHWRCIRALVDAVAILAYSDSDLATRIVNQLPDSKVKQKCIAQVDAGGRPPRLFFW